MGLGFRTLGVYIYICIFLYTVASTKLGVSSWVPNNKDSSIMVFILGCPFLWKLPYVEA